MPGTSHDTAQVKVPDTFMIRFRLALVTLMGVLIVFTVTTIGVCSYLNSRSAARELSGQVLDQTSERIELQVGKLINQATVQCALTVELLKSGQLTSDDFPNLVAYWRGVMRVQPELTALYIGLEATGESVGVSRLGGKLTIWETRWNAALANFDLRQYRPADYPSKPFKSEAAGPDSRLRPWYVAARERRRPIWTPSYVFLEVEGSGKVLGVSHAVPFLNPDGSLQSVVLADFDLRTISQFLAGLRIGEQGAAFLVERSQQGILRVVAHPRSEILVRPGPGTGGGGEHVPINELADARVPAFLKQLPAATQSAGSGVRELVRFRSDGEDYLGIVNRIESRFGPEWLVCTFIPEDEVLAFANQSNQLTLLIAVFVLGVALMLSLYLARQVAQPLEQLASDALAAGHLCLAARPRIQSVVLEVDGLARASEEMRSGLRSFEKYVPAELVRGLLESGQEANLGGENRVVTVSFSDIAGFTGIAETMSSEALVAHLGEYLALMSEEIQRSGGTVDKFIGDAVMAFWGAPSISPNHAVAACVAALRCQQRLRELRPEWQARNQPLFPTRTGLHTGEVIVGNIGSPTRMNYTVMGDAVNLASRLEGLNKYYATEILVSEQTYEAVQDVVLARPVDWVAVKGRAEALAVYELLGLSSEVTAATRDLADQYAAALTAFRSRRWGEALSGLDEVLRMQPGDGPARVLRERCQQCLQAHPGDDWDGVQRMTSK